jgi:hypothetical protein
MRVGCLLSPPTLPFRASPGHGSIIRTGLQPPANPAASPSSSRGPQFQTRPLRQAAGQDRAAQPARRPGAGMGLYRPGSSRPPWSRAPLAPVGPLPTPRCQASGALAPRNQPRPPEGSRAREGRVRPRRGRPPGYLRRRAGPASLGRAPPPAALGLSPHATRAIGPAPSLPWPAVLRRSVCPPVGDFPRAPGEDEGQSGRPARLCTGNFRLPGAAASNNSPVEWATARARCA